MLFLFTGTLQFHSLRWYILLFDEVGQTDVNTLVLKNNFNSVVKTLTIELKNI